MEITFNIGPNEYKVPDRITLEVFEKAVVWDLNKEKELKPFVATILGCTIGELDLLEIEVWAFIAGVCIQRMDVTKCQLQPEIGGYALRHLDSLSFGQWVDLDLYATWGAMQNISKITAVLYDAPEEVCSQWDIKSVWGAVNLFGNWRASVYKEYDEFFELSSQTGEDVEESRSNNNIQLMWYEAILVLANEDFTKIDHVTSRPYREALNFLTWKKAKVAKQKLEQLKHKHDLQRNRR